MGELKQQPVWLLFFFTMCAGEVLSQVVLSEIMFDAAGNEAHDEFVEIFNTSATDSFDLSGWQISDGSGFDSIIEVNKGVILKPGQFGVILDASYFGNSITYDDHIPENSLLLTIDNLTFGNAGFSNSTAETISLINSAGLVVSEYTYSLDNQMGFSDEKIDLAGPNTPENWGNSRVQLGTPGAPNSVSPLNYDLAVSPEDLMFSPQTVSAGETVTIFGFIENRGRLMASNFSAILYDDLNHNAHPETEEELVQFDFNEPLASGDSVRFEFRYENIAPDRHPLIVQVEFALDENVSNNLAQKELLVGYAVRALVINELMYSPLSNQAEWVEIFNPGFQTVNLIRWRLSDSGTPTNDIAADIQIAPGGYAVLAQDSSIFDFFNPPAGAVTVLNNWPSLDNDFDSVVLYDLTGNPIDQVNYSSGWGGAAGFSLEKINPNLSSNDSSNWNTCVAFLGGTPGEQNSIFSEILVSDATITIAPNPFSPDGDGRDDFALITFELPLTTAVVNVKIYDMRGRLIRFLANNESSGSRKTLVWDGKDDNGQAARLGIYVVYLQALNAQAGEIKTQKQTVVLASRL